MLTVKKHTATMEKNVISTAPMSPGNIDSQVAQVLHTETTPEEEKRVLRKIDLQ